MSKGFILTTLFILSTAGMSAQALGPGSHKTAATSDRKDIAWETVRMEIAEDLALQVDTPLQAFGNTLIESQEFRDSAAKAAMDDIYAAETAKCRLTGVRDFVDARDYFLNGAVMKAGAQEAGELRQRLMGDRTFYKVAFTSSTPPDPTDRIVPLIREAGAKVKALNSAFNSACANTVRKIDALPASEAAEIVKLNTELKQVDEALSGEVKQIVDGLNRHVNAMDIPLVEWAVQALAKAKPQQIPAALD